MARILVDKANAAVAGLSPGAGAWPMIEYPYIQKKERPFDKLRANGGRWSRPNRALP